MTKVHIAEASTPDELRAHQKDAGSVMVARLATRPGFTKADWKMAIRAFRAFVDASLAAKAAGRLPAGFSAGLTEKEAQAFFEWWYLMLNIRRRIAAEDAAKRGNPEDDG